MRKATQRVTNKDVPMGRDNRRTNPYAVRRKRGTETPSVEVRGNFTTRNDRL